MCALIDAPTSSSDAAPPRGKFPQFPCSLFQWLFRLVSRITWTFILCVQFACGADRYIGSGCYERALQLIVIIIIRILNTVERLLGNDGRSEAGIIMQLSMNADCRKYKKWQTYCALTPDSRLCMCIYSYSCKYCVQYLVLVFLMRCSNASCEGMYRRCRYTMILVWNYACRLCVQSFIHSSSCKCRCLMIIW